MTWLKLSDDFNKDCRRAHISDAAFRVHVEMLCFCMDDENGGFVNVDDVISTSRATNPTIALKELIDCDFWVELTPDRWQITHQMDNQPEVDVMEARRIKNAERQRRRRRKSAGLEDDSGSMSRRDYPRDDTRDRGRENTRDPGRVGSGRNGESQQTNPALDEKEDPNLWRACPDCGSLDSCDCLEG